ncbi:MAG: AAA family ATPase [Gammaproteobacteria bacterium]|nr:AAA family ATPase [Gammaproteobacteria bacterium]
MNREQLSLFGLKWNPFAPELPIEALFVTPAVDSFCRRIENHLLRQGGFALVTSDPGTGKSAVLRQLALRLDTIEGLRIAALSHPSSRLADFYREMGELFGIALVHNNRWNGFKLLRDRWRSHLHDTRMRPLLLIDEAQELQTSVLTEIRLLASTEFDSRTILSVVLAGDSRLLDKFRTQELAPLASRIRHRLTLDAADPDGLAKLLDHLLRAAGNPALMTAELKTALTTHAGGNPRSLAIMADSLLAAAAESERTQLDESLFFEVFGTALPGRRTRR